MKDPINEIRKDLQEEIVGTWDAIADMGESDLLEAWGELSEKGDSDLARRIFEGAIDFVLDELLLGESYSDEWLKTIVDYRKNQGLSK